MNYTSKISAFIFLFFININLSNAQSQDKIYSVFLLNFIKYVEWPSSESNNEFVIGVIGTTSIGDYLKSVSSLKTAGIPKILLKQCRSINDVNGCHMLFIAEDKSSIVPEISNKLSNEATLLVTEKSGLAKKNGGISFLLVDDKIKFEINKTAMERKGLKISSSLSSLGIIVSN